jgi:hypothetical protein
MSGKYIWYMPSLPGQNNVEGSFKNKTASFLHWRENNKCTFHFIALIVFLSVLPLLEDSEVARIFTDLMLVILLFFAVQAISHEIYLMIAGFLLVGITIILYALYYLTTTVHYFNAAIVVTLVFFIMVSIAIFAAVIREQEIRRDTIFGAISVYFLLGLTWALGIMVLVIFSPSSFDIATSRTDQLVYISDYIGFSFSILTTTGNYNVAALTSTARTVLMFEMISGTLYIAVLVSWLVGKLLKERQAGQ